MTGPRAAMTRPEMVRLAIVRLAAFAVTCSLFAAAAAADSGSRPPITSVAPRGIALQAQVGEPSPQTAIVGPVLRELERQGYASRPASISALLGGHAPRPGIADRGITTRDIAALSERGIAAFDHAQYEQAIALLGIAVDKIRDNPGLGVLDAGHAQVAFRTFVGLALGQARLGLASDSAETMMEVVRTFPLQPVSRSEYGPEAEAFFRAVQKQAHAMGRGQLAITTGEPRALVFVNGELRGSGRAHLSGLIPGRYRVLIQVPGSDGRRFEVEVRADRSAALEVDWPAVSALTVSETWVGFAYADEAGRATEPARASGLARQWGHETIIVVGATEVDGARAAIGTLYDARGAVVRSAIAIPGDDPTKLYALASFLATGTASRDLRVVLGAAGSRPAAADQRARPGYARWLIVAAGALALGAGGSLLLIDQDYGYRDAAGNRPAHYRDTAPLGIAVGLAGLATVGIGMWVTRIPDRPAQPSLSIAPSAVIVGYTLRY